jgi:hypothetical protein
LEKNAEKETVARFWRRSFAIAVTVSSAKNKKEKLSSGLTKALASAIPPQISSD